MNSPATAPELERGSMTSSALPVQRGARARLNDLARELLLSPLPRSLCGGAAILALGLADGMHAGAAVALAAATAIVLFAVLRTLVQIGREVRNTVDGSVLAALLGPNMPALGTWAIEADLGALVYQEMHRRPQVVAECGSGVTTLIVAACLRRQGAGRLYSLEHSKAFADATRADLAAADLSEWVELIHAPLSEQRFRDTETAWYDVPTALTRVPDSVELLIVDGPPAVEPWSRWPALEVFDDRLTPGAVVLLDDGRRRSERRTVSRWRSEHPNYALFWHDTLKGTWKLTKRAAPRSDGPLTSAVRALVCSLNPTPSAFGRWPVSR